MDLKSKITITLAAEGPGEDLPIRLRKFLKWSLRQAGLRCVAIAEVDDPTRPIADTGKALPGDAGLGTTQSTPGASARQKAPYPY